MPKKTRSDRGTQRPLTKQEKHMERAKNLMAEALAELALAVEISPTTDNRRRVTKRAKR
jgi:hypothetical protein